jgi:hypothetical protein
MLKLESYEFNTRNLKLPGEVAASSKLKRACTDLA